MTQLGPVPGTNEQSQTRQNVAIQQLFAFLAAGDNSLTALGIGYGNFSVDRNGSNQTGMTSGIDNKILFNHEAFDPDGVFDAVTNFRYQPLKAGYYSIGLMCTTNSATASGSAMVTRIYKNGSVLRKGTKIDVNNASTRSFVSDLVNLNGSTDYIEGFVGLPSDITAISGDISDTWMYGWRVSP